MNYFSTESKFHRHIPWMFGLPTLVVAFSLVVISPCFADNFANAIKQGDTLRRQGSFDAALGQYEAAKARAANDTERGLAIGKQAEVYSHNLNNHNAAKRAANDVLALSEAAPVARVIGLQVLARCQMKADKDFDSAVGILKKATQLDGVDWAQPTVALMLGDCYRETDQPQKAIDAYRTVTQLQSASDTVKAIAYLNGGLTAQYNLHQPDRAKEFYAIAVQLDASLQTEVDKHLAATSITTSRPLILAHYMPWFSADPIRDHWGWHWTMNHFDPEKLIDGQRDIASEFHPLIGPYDSGDPHVIEYHLLLMKLAGIDGVIVDWYGLQEFRDYAQLHENTLRLVEQIQRLDMKLVICYEDQTISALVNAKRITDSNRVRHVAQEITWLADNWFKLSNYVRLDDKPVLLSFGNLGLSNDEWTECFDQVQQPIAYFSEHIRRDSAAGGFDWPNPQTGAKRTSEFTEMSKSWKYAIPVVFPRFVDVYAEAGVNDGYPRLEDNDGETYRVTLKTAIDSHSHLVQIATWNDWGEGTQIEPSQEYGYRDLEVLQKLIRERFDMGFQPTSSDLRLPAQILELRRSKKTASERLDEIAKLIAGLRIQPAREKLESLAR